MPDPRPTVLVVEDEPLILIHSRLALEDAGFAIVAARDAAEALDLLAASRDLRALFTDVRLPGPMNGIALAHRVRAERGDIAIVVTSGSQAVDPVTLPADAVFIPKPYTAAQVTRLLDRVAA